MVKEIFDELEEYKFGKELFTAKVAKDDITSKDGRVLSQKQTNCLYNYFDLDLDITLKYIKDNNYNEISKTIGEALSNRQQYYNSYEDNYGDR